MSLSVNVASLAMGLEALETLLVEKGILKDNELLDKLKEVSTAHYSKGEFLPPSED